MAYYNYKQVRDQLPQWVTDEIEDYEGSCDYDGDQWIAASNYIDYLERQLLLLNPDFKFDVRKE